MTLIDLHGSTFDRAMPKKLQIIRKNAVVILLTTALFGR